MNRRSFITKVLAGAAAIPLLSKAGEVFFQQRTYQHTLATYDIALNGNAQVLCLYVDGRRIAPSDYIVRDGQIHMSHVG